MNDSWLSGIDPAKLQMLFSMSGQGASKSQNELMPFLIKDCAECLDAMNAAAEKGWQSTKDLVAKIGRASRLGERSRGVLDAGATSCYFIITTIGSTAKSLL